MNASSISPTRAFAIAVAVVCLIRVPLLILTRNWDSLIVFAGVIVVASVAFLGYLKFTAKKP